MPEVDLELTFDQAALGTTATVTMAEDTACPACAGRGSGAATSACADCGGLGATSRRSGGITIRTTCSSCGGTGQGAPARCDACGGAGTTTTTREVTVRIPAGIEDGGRLRLQTPGGPVEAIVRVGAHPFFERRDLDVTIRLPVTLAEAALGSVVTVPTLDGAVTIRLPPGTPHGRVLRVAGRGIANASSVGHLLVTVAIDVPSTLNDRQRSALESYADATASPRRHLEGHRRAGSTDHPHDQGQGGRP